jgi:hypothetical protein
MMKIYAKAMVFAALLSVGQAWAEDKPAQYSGFLEDYSKLVPAKDREGILIYINKTADYSGYTKIMFEPVQVFLTPNPDYKGVQPDVLKRMTDGFLDSFRRNLTPAYEIVHEPGPDVLRVKTAITGVQMVNPAMGVADVVPLKALFNLGRKATGTAPQVIEMTAEMEVFDANGQSLVQAVATRKGEKTLKQGDQITWEEMQAITDYWAKGFRQRMDQLRDIK